MPEILYQVWLILNVWLNFYQISSGSKIFSLKITICSLPQRTLVSHTNTPFSDDYPTAQCVSGSDFLIRTSLLKHLTTHYWFPIPWWTTPQQIMSLLFYRDGKGTWLGPLRISRKLVFFFFAHRSSIASRYQETGYKLLTPWYRIPTPPLHRIFPLVSLCWRYHEDTGTLIYISWLCPCIGQLWEDINRLIYKITEISLELCTQVLMLHITLF